MIAMVKNGHVAISSRVTQLYANGPGHVIESIRDTPRERIYNLSERAKKRKRGGGRKRVRFLAERTSVTGNGVSARTTENCPNFIRI